MKIPPQKSRRGGGALNSEKIVEKRVKIAVFSVFLTLVIASIVMIIWFFFPSVKGAPEQIAGVTLGVEPAEGGYIIVEGVIMEAGYYSTSTFRFGFDIISAMPNDGYAFVKWIYTVSGPAEYESTSQSMTMDEYTFEYIAYFEQISFNVGVATSDTSMGAVSGGGVYSYDATESATITATPSAGYAFSHWLNSAGDIVSTSAIYTFTVTATDTYTAVFREYALSITTNNSGSEISSQKIDELNTMTTYALTFTTGKYLSQIQFNNGSLRDIKYNSGTFGDVEGCTAVTYYANSSGSELILNVYNYNGALDLEIKLYFVNTAQSLKQPSGSIETTAVNATNGGEVRLTGSDLIGESDTVVCIAVPYAGYVFDGWTDSDGNNLGTDLSLRLTKEQVQGKIITANFSLSGTNVNTNVSDFDSLS
ncbi:MAG: hypothetical protein IJ301_01095 [Clostridia bacterium]|nr:hypothetical protein [Clostridia bacterium]